MLTSFKKQISASIIAATFALSGSAFAADLEKIHFIIPGGAGGGWDMTARGTGDVLLKSNLIEQPLIKTFLAVAVVKPLLTLSRPPIVKQTP